MKTPVEPKFYVGVRNALIIWVIVAAIYFFIMVY